ncbi:MAG: chromosomal replication initiator protein DnaA [Armatimonadota bacterium]
MDEQLRLGEDDALVRLKRAWDEALKLLEPEINRASFQSFFKTARPIESSEGKVTIGATSELARIFLDKYSEHIRTALESAGGTDYDISFVVAPKEQPKGRAPQPKPERRPATVSSVSQQLNEKYTFANFVVGPSNRLAHAVARSIAESPAETYNPLFLYGGPGLGKTHLLQAIGNHILANLPDKRVAYVSGEMFTSHYVTALREHRSEDFRQKYRNIDVWLVDDIQFLAGKERTKEEFFHTFNTLYQMNKQIILSSDRSPRDLDSMEDRLKSRFESGVVCDVSAPDFETRLAIVQRKVRQEKVDIPAPVQECVASLVQTNVRALEGALISLIAHTSLMKVPLSPQLAEQLLSRYISEKRCAELTPDTIQHVVARHFGLDAAVLRSEKRQKEIVAARHLAMYLTRELTEYTLPAIGRAFGGRNHATVVHACSRMRSELEEDTALQEAVEKLSQDLKSGRW